MRRAGLRYGFGRFATVLGLSLLQPLAHGQDYPSKPVTILVAYAPGGQGGNMAVPRNTPAEFAAFVNAEAEKFDRLAREANLRAAQ